MDASSSFEGVEISKRKRGPYKLYLAPSLPGESVSRPRTTKWRRLLTENSEENPTEDVSDELDNGLGEIGETDISHDNPEETNESVWNIYETSNASAQG